MDFESVEKHFDGTDGICAALGVTKGAVSQWRNSVIPPMRQFQIEALTKGKLKADRVAPSKAQAAA